jgi:hypothetical protein
MHPHGEQLACPAHDKDDPQQCTAAVTFMPYVLEMSGVFSTMDRTNLDEKARLVRDLEVSTSSLLEALIADPANTPSLDQATDLGAFPTAAAALGNVEAALLRVNDHTGSAGTVYMSPVEVTEMGTNSLIESDGSLYTFATHSLAVVGNFPPGVIYGHIGEVDVYVGDVIINEFPDTLHTTNEYTAQVERLAMACWNTCAVFKAEVVAAP